MKLLKILIALVCVLGATNTMCMLVDAVKQQEKVEVKTNDEATKDLFEAIEKKDLKAVELAIENGADVNATHNYYGTPLITAVVDGNLEIVKLLIKHKAHVKATDKDGEAPLHMAVQRGYFEMVKLLIDNGADVNTETLNQDQKMPLHMAAIGDNLEIVNFLIANGADLHAGAGGMWDTPLKIALKHNSNPKIIRSLILGDRREYLQDFPVKYLSVLDKNMQDFITWFKDGASINQLSKEQIIVFTPIALTMPAAFTEFKALLKLIKPSDYETIFTEQVISNAGMTKNADALELLISNIMPNLEQKTALTFLKLLEDPKTESKLKPLQNSYLKLLQRIYASAQENKLNSITQLILKDMELLRTNTENLPQEISAKIGSFVSKD